MEGRLFSGGFHSIKLAELESSFALYSHILLKNLVSSDKSNFQG
jgi:hypothetical protein